MKGGCIKIPAMKNDFFSDNFTLLYIAAANQEGRSRLAMADPVGLPSTNRGDDDLISAKSH